MKKIFLVMLVAAGMAATSCEQSFDEGVTAAGKEAKVSVNLAFPTIQTRAYSDGTTATELKYAVFEKKGGNLTRLETYTKTDDVINISKQIDFQLVTGRTYQFVFWAAAPSEERVWTNPYTVEFTNNGATMTADYTGAVANDERYDAFFASVEKTITGDVQMSVELTRPFAQINVGTSDYEVVKGIDAAPNRSYVRVTNAYTQLDLVSGAVANPTKITLGYGQIPGSTYNDNKKDAEPFPVVGYDYLAMAYILASPEEAVVDVDFGYAKDADASTVVTRTVGSVPIKRNHRTNMFGQVLTSTASVNVIIVPEYKEPDYNYDQLLFAAAVGGSVTLTDDVDVPGELTFTKDAVIDLGGNEIKATGGTGGDAIVVKSGANVTLKNGTVKEAQNANANSAVIYVSSATPASVTLEEMTLEGSHPVYVNSAAAATTVTINSGNYTCSGTNGEVVYVQKGGKVVINGGTFSNPKATTYQTYLLNIKDDFRKTLNDPREAIEVFGGTFINFNPADCGSEGYPTNFVAKGYKSVETSSGNDKIYVVVPDDAIELSSTENDLAGAISEFAKSDATEMTVLFKENINYSLKKDSNAQTVVWPSNKKLTFIGGGKETVLADADYFTAEGCEIEFKDVTLKVFENSTNHTAIGFKNAAKVSLTNVEIYGEFHAFSGDVTFNNCSFYYGGGGASNGSRYGIYCESAGKTVISGCKFDTSCKTAETETKGILVYSDQGNTEMGDIDITDCVFKVEGKVSTKAAIEIHSEKFAKAGTLNITNTTYTENGYIALWREINNSTQDKTQFYTVIVDGVEVQKSAK